MGGDGFDCLAGLWRIFSMWFGEYGMEEGREGAARVADHFQGIINTRPRVRALCSYLQGKACCSSDHSAT